LIDNLLPETYPRKHPTSPRWGEESETVSRDYLTDVLDPDVTFWDVMLFQSFGMDHRGLDARAGSYGLSRDIGEIIAFPY
jgi:hypothetical protein